MRSMAYKQSRARRRDWCFMFQEFMLGCEVKKVNTLGNNISPRLEPRYWHTASAPIDWSLVTALFLPLKLSTTAFFLCQPSLLFSLFTPLTSWYSPLSTYPRFPSHEFSFVPQPVLTWDLLHSHPSIMSGSELGDRFQFTCEQDQISCLTWWTKASGWPATVVRKDC